MLRRRKRRKIRRIFLYIFLLSCPPCLSPFFDIKIQTKRGKNGKRAQTKRNRERASARGMNREKKKKKKCVRTLKRNRMKGLEAVDLSSFDSVACC
jgi:hypothetical protein